MTDARTAPTRFRLRALVAVALATALSFFMMTPATALDNSNISAATVDIADQTYTGKKIEPSLIVTLPGITLSPGTDYTVTYSNNINVGTGTATVTGTGLYEGTSSSTFKIEAASISLAVIDAITDQIHTGSAIEPALTVTDSHGNSLIADKDYTVAYSNNIDAGVATATITGTGNYTGKVTKPFVIAGVDIQDTAIEAINGHQYTGSPIEPPVVVTHNGVPLARGTDYTVAYSNNTAEGYATVTVTGMGKYTGTKTATFYIYMPDLIAPQNTTLSFAGGGAFTYTGKAIRPKVTVVFGTSFDSTVASNGSKIALTRGPQTLVEGTDYTVAYSNNTEVGTGTVMVTGIGDFYGTVSANFTINAEPVTAPTPAPSTPPVENVEEPEENTGGTQANDDTAANGEDAPEVNADSAKDAAEDAPATLADTGFEQTTALWLSVFSLALIAGGLLISVRSRSALARPARNQA